MSLCEAGYDMALLDFGSNDLSAGCYPGRYGHVCGRNTCCQLRCQIGDDQRFFKRERGNSHAFLISTMMLCFIILQVALKQQLSMHEHIHIYHHQGFVDEWEQYLLDGVHLNEAGMTTYAKSMRRAILKNSSHFIFVCNGLCY